MPFWWLSQLDFSLGVGYVLYFGMRTCLINFLGLDLPIWGLKIQSSAFKKYAAIDLRDHRNSLHRTLRDLLEKN